MSISIAIIGKPNIIANIRDRSRYEVVKEEAFVSQAKPVKKPSTARKKWRAAMLKKNQQLRETMFSGVRRNICWSNTPFN